MKKCIFFVGLVFLFAGCSEDSSNPASDEPDINADYIAKKAETAPLIDGKADDACWETVEWDHLEYLWLGASVPASDFSGKCKIVWTAEKLYILVEVVDDVLSDLHENPLDKYWEDDCLEFFIDEDASGGVHDYSHNAFAYHIALDYKAVDLSPDRQAKEYTDHVTVARITTGTTSIWEVALDVYTSLYRDSSASNPKAQLKDGKVMGYAMAYCDADGHGNRESFYGTNAIAGVDKNVAWKNADVFGLLLLSE